MEAVGSVGGVVNALDFNVKIKNTAAHDPQGGPTRGHFSDNSKRSTRNHARLEKESTEK